MRYLITLRLDPPNATLERAQAGLAPSGLTIDADFGLVLISPKRGLYTVRADGKPEEAEAAALAEEVVSVHGDVRVAPMDQENTGGKGD